METAVILNSSFFFIYLYKSSSAPMTTGIISV